MIIRALAFAAALGLSGTAAAQTAPAPEPAQPNMSHADHAEHAGTQGMTAEQKTKLQNACAADIRTHCASAGDDEAALHRCMKDNRAKLSAACSTAIKEVKAEQRPQ